MPPRGRKNAKRSAGGRKRSARGSKRAAARKGGARKRAARKGGAQEAVARKRTGARKTRTRAAARKGGTRVAARKRTPPARARKPAAAGLQTGAGSMGLPLRNESPFASTMGDEGHDRDEMTADVGGLGDDTFVDIDDHDTGGNTDDDLEQ